MKLLRERDVVTGLATIYFGYLDKSREMMDLEELDSDMRRHRTDFDIKTCDARRVLNILSRENHIGVELPEFAPRGGDEVECVVKKISGVDGGWKMMVNDVDFDQPELAIGWKYNRLASLSAG